MKYMLDSSAFMNMMEIDLDGKLYTTPPILKEIKDHRTKALFESRNIEIREPSKKYLEKVQESSNETGESGILSDADVSIIALALELGGIVVTDDYGVQNLCLDMKIEFVPVKNKKISRKFKRITYCPNCRKKRFSETCGVCGSDTISKVVNVEYISDNG